MTHRREESASSYVHVSVRAILRITAAGMLVVIGEDDEQEEVWLPLSQVADSEKYEQGDEDLTISVSEWIAEKKGLKGS